MLLLSFKEEPFFPGRGRKKKTCSLVKPHNNPNEWLLSVIIPLLCEPSRCWQDNIDPGKRISVPVASGFPGGVCISPDAHFSHRLRGNNVDRRPCAITVWTREGLSEPQPDTLGKTWDPAAHGGGLLGGQHSPTGLLLISARLCECGGTQKVCDRACVLKEGLWERR